MQSLGTGTCRDHIHLLYYASPAPFIHTSATSTGSFIASDVYTKAFYFTKLFPSLFWEQCGNNFIFKLRAFTVRSRFPSFMHFHLYPHLCHFCSQLLLEYFLTAFMLLSVNILYFSDTFLFSFFSVHSPY